MEVYTLSHMEVVWKHLEVLWRRVEIFLEVGVHFFVFRYVQVVKLVPIVRLIQRIELFYHSTKLKIETMNVFLLINPKFLAVDNIYWQLFMKL